MVLDCGAGAGDGNRTHVASLEGWSSTIELHPPANLPCALPTAAAEDASHRPYSDWWRGLDSNQRTPKRADLQSAAFNRSATPPHSLAGRRSGCGVLRSSPHFVNARAH